MKLLFYIHGLSGGGAERVMATLMNAFVAQGHEVRVVYTSSIDEPVYDLDIKVEQVYMQRLCPMQSNSIVAKIFKRIWKYPAIRRQAKAYKPDFVISFIKANNNDVLVALLGSGIPVIIGDHTNVDRKYRWPTSFLSNIFYPTATAITMLTMRDYDKWKDKYKNVYYMPNPCDLKPKTTIESRRKIVIGVGRVNQWKIKGFDSLIIAWNKIKDKHPDWACQIAGKYSDQSLNELKTIVGESAFESIEFLGFRQDIHDYMQRCEVFCLSSRIEGMPVALLEAMNLGCACVSFDCITGPSEIIEDAKTGLLVKDQDIEDLSNKLDMVLSQKELRELFHRNAHQSVERYSTNSILKMWNEMFNDLKSK